MQKMILAILTFIFCLLWAEVKVEKVLETTSIKEYNQWVKRNKARCRDLKLVYIQVNRPQNLSELHYHRGYIYSNIKMEVVDGYI